MPAGKPGGEGALSTGSFRGPAIHPPTAVLGGRAGERVDSLAHR